MRLPSFYKEKKAFSELLKVHPIITKKGIPDYRGCYYRDDNFYGTILMYYIENCLLSNCPDRESFYNQCKISKIPDTLKIDITEFDEYLVKLNEDLFKLHFSLVKKSMVLPLTISESDEKKYNEINSRLDTLINLITPIATFFVKLEAHEDYIENIYPIIKNRLKIEKG